MTNKTGEVGPVYDVELIDVLPLQGRMLQAMPNRADLERVRKVSERTVSAYEVLLQHYQNAMAQIDELKAEIKRLEHHIAAETELVFLKQGRS